MKKYLVSFLPFALFITLLTSCGPVPEAERTITIASKDFTEQFILGNIMKLALEDKGWQVDVKINLGGTTKCRAALESGEIDVYMEYTGTALINFLNHEEPIADPPLCFQTVKG